jgi:uncharacterized protein DUF2637
VAAGRGPRRLVAALAALVLAIAALAYVVSFEAIRAFAVETAAFPLALAWSAPLLVDSFTTAASLVILWRYLRGNGSGPQPDNRSRMRELVAQERTTGTRLHAREVAAAAGISERRAYGCSALSGPRSQRHDPSALYGVPGAGCRSRWSGRDVRLSSFIGMNLIYDTGRSFGPNRENRLRRPGQ